MRAICYLTLLFLTGCASVPEAYWHINRATSERFTYVTDFEKHGVADYREEGVTGSDKFTGDCEEYARAIQYQLGIQGVQSTVYVVKRKYDYHALTCSEDGFCFDAYTVPMRRESVRDIFITKL